MKRLKITRVPIFFLFKIVIKHVNVWINGYFIEFSTIFEISLRYQ